MDDGGVNLGTLSAGEHTLTIVVREPSAQSLLDVICLTPSAEYVPTDIDVDFTALKAITILAPRGGETFSVGDTLVVRWNTIVNQVPEVLLQMSIDGGESWITLNPGGSISSADPSWGAFALVLGPDRVCGTCHVRVVNYNQQAQFEQTPAAFSVVSTAVVARAVAGSACTRAGARVLHGVGGETRVVAPGRGQWRVQVCDLRGVLLGGRALTAGNR
jgi:hypothetical protein